MPKKRTGLSDMDKRIIRLMAKHSMCLAAVADEMHYHGNTVRYHVDIIRRDTGKDASQFYDLVSLLRDLGEMPGEQLAHGRWFDTGVENETGNIYFCSSCGKLNNPNKKDVAMKRAKEKPAYCPNCGAKMDLEGGNT